MLLDIPFFANTNEGNQCMQVAMQTAIRYFLDKEYSLEELDALTGRKKGKWTWTQQVVSVLYDVGLEVKYFSKAETKNFLQGEEYIRKEYGKDAETIIKMTDFPVLISAIQKLQKSKLYERKILTLGQIEKHIKERHIPLILVDYNILYKKKGQYLGHFVAVTGFDKEDIYYHEPGPHNPTPYKRAKKEMFMNAWNSKSTDNDIIIVFGKR